MIAIEANGGDERDEDVDWGAVAVGPHAEAIVPYQPACRH